MGTSENFSINTSENFSKKQGFAPILIIILILSIIVFAGFVSWKFKPKPPAQTNNQNVETPFASQEECEAATGKACSFFMCDVVPEGKTFEETCGKNFKAGWKPKNQTTVEETVIVQLVKKDLADFLKIPENSISVLSIAKAQWPDSCFGVDNGELCAQIITPGYKISLKGTGNSVYIYHTDLNNNFALEKPIPGNL